MNDDMNTALEWLVGLVLFPLLMLSNFIGYALGLPPQAGGGESEAEDSEPTEAEALEINEELQADAIRALKTLGFPRERAKQAVLEALNADPDATIEEIVKCALRRQK
jgi:Holliday junction resolvasome RuvABC DNA-binding subunit